MEEKKRLKKYKREKNAFSGMQIQRRDLEILKSLAGYRFLNTPQIIALHPGGERNIQRRLQKLFHEGFIDRPPRQLSYLKPQGYMIYGIGNRGVDLLSENFPDLKRTKVDWQTKNKEVKQRYIDHTLMISNFRVVLNLALRNEKHTRLVSWQQGRDLRDYVRIDDRRIALVPDAFFTLEDSEDKMYFFLEADRSTMTRGRFLRKMKVYWEWWKKGGHEEKLGIKSFRVLNLCEGEARKKNLRQISREADDRKTGSLMFWFAT
ncbi:MAG: replication-relaxation family protein, partial [Candidatus Zixiibacteriota bacterium]